MKLIQKVLIKQVITEKSKQKLYESFKRKIMQLEQECQQLLFEQRKVKLKSTISKHEIQRRFQREIDNRKEQIKLLEFKIDQLQLIEIGSELVEKEVEALVEVAEGMRWQQFQKERAIVIKDGIIIRIDE